MRFGERMRLAVELFGVVSNALSSFCHVSLDLAPKHINDRENAIANTPGACTPKMPDYRSPGIGPHGLGGGVGRALGVGSDFGVGVGLPLAVGDGVGVTVPVAVVVAAGVGRGGRVGRGEYVGSGRGVAVGKGVNVGVGVGVAVPIGNTRT